MQTGDASLSLTVTPDIVLGSDPQEMFTQIDVAAFTLSFSPTLAAEVLGATPGAAQILQGLRNMREEAAREMGVVIPGVHLRDDEFLKESQYAIRVRDRLVVKGSVELGRVLLVAKEDLLERFDGTACLEPAQGIPAKWIAIERMEDARARNGTTVLDPISVIVSHVAQVARDKMADVFSIDNLSSFFDHLAEKYPALLSEFKGYVPLYTAFRAYRTLLAERVWPHDPVTTLELMLEASVGTSEPRELAEAARKKLVPDQLASGKKQKIAVCLIDASLEEAVSDALEGYGSLLQTDLGMYIRIEVYAYAKSRDKKDVNILCAAKQRLAIAELFIDGRFKLNIYAKDEIPRDIAINKMAEIGAPLVYETEGT